MRKFLSILVLMLCQFYVANAQKCLVSFGVNEEVTEMPIENALYTLYLNDSIQVPYRVTYADVQSATYSLEFDFRPGKYTLRVEKEGYNDVY